ncbi:MAG: spore coat protein YlbD [Bacilli bacterium]
MSNSLHPSVSQFKAFVERHPRLAVEVKRGNATWQSLFEKWYLLGENDRYWLSFRSDYEPTPMGKNGESVVMDEPTEPVHSPNTTKEEEKKRTAPDLLALAKGINLGTISTYLTNFNQAISTIQDLVGTFQSDEEKEETKLPKLTKRVKSLKD